MKKYIFIQSFVPRDEKSLQYFIQNLLSSEISSNSGDSKNLCVLYKIGEKYIIIQNFVQFRSK